ncbi:response regulator transcription factor [Microvirga aerilata]|uniref:Response regulator transcription factor n=1 Tax=Microvirga aerilata TaxID=670292 RepID=A0A936ZBT2_9HYPH|nr:response regulator transcription factor [Microvirga aerilata]MBL0403774.1 response regulator transcription factor [Microvirga aerilata]
MSGEAAKERKEYVTVLISKNPLLSMGLELLLAHTRFAVSELGSDEPSSRRLRLHIQPDLFIVDASPSSEDLLTTIKLLKVQHPEARIAVVADNFDISFVRLGIDAGVDGFCLSTSHRDVLIKSLELVMMGESTLPMRLVRSMLSEMTLEAKPDQDSATAVLLSPDPGMHKLSIREAEILRHIMGGEPNKVIARKLDVAEATIKVHIKAILRKIGAANRTQAAMWATEHLTTKGGKP